MIDGNGREEERLEVLMHTSRHVDVFGIHEEMLIEKPCLFQCREPEKHETARLIRRIDNLIVTKFAQFVEIIALIDDERRQAKSAKHIEWGRQ